MSVCFEEGQLRAYLDGELAPAERAALGAHAENCPRCAAALAEARTRAASLRALLPPAPVPNAQSALARVRAAALVPQPLAAAERPAYTRRMSMLSQRVFGSGRSRGIAAAALTVLLLAGLFALPPVRAAADSLLSVFRVQKVLFVPVGRDRLEQISQLKGEQAMLFVGKPDSNDRTPPRTVGSAAEAAAATGYALHEPASLPAAPTSTIYNVISGGSKSFTVNVDAARQLLSALDIRDVTLPDTLGTAPIQVDMAASASTEYVGPGYAITLRQATSPNVTLPDGVDMAQLGYATLRVLGSSPEQAELLSRQINWNSTLLVPFPTDTNNLRQVTVNGEPALLMTNGPRNSQGGAIYWQQGGTIYILQGSDLKDMGEQEIADLLVRTAESVQ